MFRRLSRGDQAKFLTLTEWELVVTLAKRYGWEPPCEPIPAEVEEYLDCFLDTGWFSNARARSIAHVLDTVLRDVPVEDVRARFAEHTLPRKEEFLASGIQNTGGLFDLLLEDEPLPIPIDTRCMAPTDVLLAAVSGPNKARLSDLIAFLHEGEFWTLCTHEIQEANT